MKKFKDLRAGHTLFCVDVFRSAQHGAQFSKYEALLTSRPYQDRDTGFWVVDAVEFKTAFDGTYKYVKRWDHMLEHANRLYVDDRNIVRPNRDLREDQYNMHRTFQTAAAREAYIKRVKAGILYDHEYRLHYGRDRATGKLNVRDLVAVTTVIEPTGRRNWNMAESFGDFHVKPNPYAVVRMTGV
ncbi:hypothetical protein BcepSauron_420 [Burkholderia phage BcepSauron]|uniref:Uncharacterized protein n=1 Tax=Burkholderia phage BcepSauron TaxID=2530033 RepID=A0A482MNU8_9CAUD|nr:hypothetical protein H1O17_gp420 [Burkholderia phage BcepSauron]QBQ74800.1 hypothetical protein BcepSauron_420 [Burkholderia phage BcepSauron]